MAQENRLKNIVIVGASGNVGGKTLEHLLEINHDIRITIITRTDSTSKFPESWQITVKKGSYDDASFLQEAFAGHELAMFALSFMGDSAQPKLIDAAAKAGVKWIITNEYAGDALNPVHRNGTPIYQNKIAALKQVEDLANTYSGLQWIGVATNIWAEMGIERAAFGVDAQNRTVNLWSDAGPINSTSINQVGKGIAKLLSLPIESTTNPRASLQHYGNNFVYLSSFVLTQQKVFDSVKRVTGTSDADWKIVHTSSEEQLEKSKSQPQQLQGMFTLIVNYLREDRGGCYEPKAKEDREVLGLQEEDLDEIVKNVLAAQQ